MRHFILSCILFLTFFNLYSQEESNTDNVDDYFMNSVSIELPSLFLNEFTINFDYTLKNSGLTFTLGGILGESNLYSLFEDRDKYPFYSNMQEDFNLSVVQDFNFTTVFIVGAQYKKYILISHKHELFPFIGASFLYKKPNFTLDTVNPSNTSFGRHKGFLASRRHNDLSMNVGFVKLFNKFYFQPSLDVVLSNRKFDYFEYTPDGNNWYNFTNAEQTVNELYVTLNLRIGYCFGFTTLFKPKLSGYR